MLDFDDPDIRESDELRECLLDQTFTLDQWLILDRMELVPEGLVRLDFGTICEQENARCIGGVWLHEDDCCTCEQCDDSILLDDSCTVYCGSRGYERTWCKHCRDNYAYHWESDDEYHDEEEDEEEEDVDSYGVAGYHDYSVNPGRPDALADDVIGVEMETYWNNPSQLVSWMTNNRLHPDNGWKAERDGSLDDEYGVEIVSKPIPYGKLIDHRDPENVWFKLFRFAKGKSRAWDMGTGYGLHLSINRSRMNRLHGIRFSRLINGIPELASQIAGRTNNNYAPFSKTARIVHQTQYHEKYMACATRSDSRFEVRIFRASWNWERFVRNCHFVESIRRYTMTCPLNDNALTAEAYVTWISKQPKNQFRELRTFLAALPASAGVEV